MNEINIDTLLATIEEEIGYACEPYTGLINEKALRIPVDQLQPIIRILREQFGCYHLSTITAQERESQPGEIELIYHFWQGKGISLIMSLPLEDPQVESILSLISGADFYEREVAEMYGVTFTGREETPPLLLPDSWDQGPPFILREETDE